MSKFICEIFLICLVSTGFAFFIEPHLNELGIGVIHEIFQILTKSVMYIAGDCSQPTADNIKLFLYTRYWFVHPLELNYTNLHEVDTTKKVVVIIHGYISGADVVSFKDLKNAYLNRYDCNVILVHWKQYAWGLYTSVVCLVPKVADLIADFLCTLSKKNSYSLRDIHLIGHSLGGQMSGLIGQVVLKKCRQRIGRITGLDPAGPLFFGRSISERLDSSDAEFVDVIHSNGGIFGYLTDVGHVDFFPNCGSIQFCKHVPIKDILYLPFSMIACHHSMSIEYMIETVRNDDLYKGVPCQKCFNPFKCPPIKSFFSFDSPTMGEQCQNFTSGSYYVPVLTG